MVAVETVQIEGSGRGLVAVTPIEAGELVLRESPVILTVTQELHQAVCAQCLRYIAGERSSRTHQLTLHWVMLWSSVTLEHANTTS